MYKGADTPFFRLDTAPWREKSTYSGCDIIPVCVGRDREGKDQIFVIGDIATLSYSIHQDKGAVRTLGRNRVRGFVRGSTTIAGSMIFNVFNQRALWEISKSKSDVTKRVVIAHQLPSFDIILNYVNEFGLESTMAIYGIQVADEGQTHSIEDVYTENTMSYVAMDIDLMERKGSKGGIPTGAIFTGSRREQTVTALGQGNTPFNYQFLVNQ